MEWSELTSRPTLTKLDNSGRKMYGHNGGVWEWTSTPLAGYPGYVPSELYPGYSSDFFDEKHFVVVCLFLSWPRKRSWLMIRLEDHTRLSPR
jgi:formylglycine-generating enzyme required for sulfatase activity